jgi:hypothetical protein
VRHQPWSVTKTVVAAAVGVAFDDGLIASLDDPIERYIEQLAGTAWEGVTIEQLLRMESGVHWDEDTPVLAVNTQVEQWIDLALDLYSEGALGATRNGSLAALPEAYEPGTEFFSEEWQTLLAAVADEVGGCDTTAGGQPVTDGGDADDAGGGGTATDGDGTGGTDGAPATPAASSLPATGGGPLLLGALLLAVAAAARRR